MELSSRGNRVFASLLLLISLSLSFQLTAVAGIEIEGSVTRTGDGAGVRDVVVEWRADDRAADATVTDGSGFFRLRGSWAREQHHEIRVALPNREALRLTLTRDGAASSAKAGVYSVAVRIAGEAGGALPAPDGRSDRPPDGSQAIVRVFYATDRARGSSQPLAYGSDRSASGRLSLGYFDVSVPREHRTAALELPKVWTIRQDPARHFSIVSAEERTYADFYRELGGVVGRSPRRETFVFVHGYNVPFDSAVFRTAQIAYDLQFDGAPILYSWPSQGNPLAYPFDANNIDWTVPHLRWFLQDVAARTGAERIHVIAHSMGNRALVQALHRIATETGAAARPSFSQILLTAPDIDADTFVELAATMKAVARGITLYASSRDFALKASHKYNKYRRAGDTQPVPVVVPDIDTIDVTAVDTDHLGLGHSYFADNRSVLSDIFRIVHDDAPPQKRIGIVPSEGSARRYWVFRP